MRWLLLSGLVALAAEDLGKFSFGYTWNRKTSGKCFALSAADRKKIGACKADELNKACPKCPVDRAIRRCTFGDEHINIFPSKETCESSWYDAHEGD